MRNSNFIKLSKNDKRTPEQIREHYEIERELADKLRKASREERRYLYTTLYDELFRRVPHHPQLTHKKDLVFQQAVVSVRMKLLKRFLYPEATFLEVGPGDCALSLEVAQHVKKVYAIDVSEHMTKNETFPENFELIISDGCSIPVPENSINIAYSDQLMEHLHPDDAHEQLQNLYKALSPCGIYICITPNPLNGPHDISKHFDNIATGFHIKEYTVTELCGLFYKAGFSKVEAYINFRIFYAKFFLLPITLCEKFLYSVHLPLRRKIANSFIMRKLLNVTLIAKKQL
jgi:ubiquinone/menaquinone biosynthesis C-methylase UbiE